MRNKVFNNKGITYLEVILTLAILGFIVTAMLSTFVSSADRNSYNKITRAASTIGSNILEKYRLMSYDEVLQQYQGMVAAGVSSIHEETDSSDFTALVKLEPVKETVSQGALIGTNDVISYLQIIVEVEHIRSGTVKTLQSFVTREGEPSKVPGLTINVLLEDIWQTPSMATKKKLSMLKVNLYKDSSIFLYKSYYTDTNGQALFSGLPTSPNASEYRIAIDPTIMASKGYMLDPSYYMNSDGTENGAKKRDAMVVPAASSTVPKIYYLGKSSKIAVKLINGGSTYTGPMQMALTSRGESNPSGDFILGMKKDLASFSADGSGYYIMDGVFPVGIGNLGAYGLKIVVGGKELYVTDFMPNPLNPLKAKACTYTNGWDGTFDTPGQTLYLEVRYTSSGVVEVSRK